MPSSHTGCIGKGLRVDYFYFKRAIANSGAVSYTIYARLREGKKYLECSQRHFTENEVLNMYLGTGIPWPDPDFASSASAPDWAKDQRLALTKLKEVTDWWIHERQIANGEFGGGWNDDVEMWRQFLPLVLAFEDEKLLAALKLLGHGLWDLERMSQGFVDELHDVEHSAEESSDSMLPLMLSSIDDPEWLLNCEKIADLFVDLWTANNDKNLMSFQSTFFSSIEVSKDERMSCDASLNIRAIQPVLLAWQYGRLSPATTSRFEERLKEWLRAWINTAEGSECGKPAKIMPSAVRFPAGSPGGPLNSGWLDPGCKYVCLLVPGIEKEMCFHHEDAFTWPSAQKPFHEVFALVAWKTASCEFLRPLKNAVEVWENLKHEEPEWNGKSTMGRENSEKWAKR